MYIHNLFLMQFISSTLDVNGFIILRFLYVVAQLLFVRKLNTEVFPLGKKIDAEHFMGFKKTRERLGQILF